MGNIKKTLTTTLKNTNISLDDFLNYSKVNNLFNNCNVETVFSRYIINNIQEKDFGTISNSVNSTLNSYNSYYSSINLDVFLLPNSNFSTTNYDIDSILIYSNSLTLAKEKLSSLNFGTKLKNSICEDAKKMAFFHIIQILNKSQNNMNETILKNFCTKFIFWIETYVVNLFKNIDSQTTFPKILTSGNLKKHQWLFLIFLNKLGCSILHIHSKDLNISNFKDLNSYSSSKTIDRLSFEQELYKFKTPTKKLCVVKKNTTSIATKKTQPIKTTLNLERTSRKKTTLPSTPTTPPTIKTNINDELSYIELAKLSVSVVMISVVNEKGDSLGLGSGVIVGKDGYILTNCHVISGGVAFKVIFETDDIEYTTTTVVKYHNIFDLAVIKIDKQCTPLNVLKEPNLVRGQKVVAIGSPLGLFNTVSDGIISGFRNFEGYNLIQYTAPSSQGSSGGAVLDMYGNLIGVCQSGFIGGQNLNLGVPSNIIFDFTSNFF